MPAIDYTLTRDELVTSPDQVIRTQFGWDMIYWLVEDTHETGCYETYSHQPLCATCALDMFPHEVDDTHGYTMESVDGYEPGFLYCDHCGTDVTEL